MRRRAILIGNGSFPPESELASLAGPAADVHRLARVLSDPAVGGFETDELIDQASFELLPRIEQRFHEAAPDDLLLVHYSGHGKLNRLGQLFLACRNTMAATLQTTSVPVELLRELVRGCDARSVVLVLDCCFSGAAARAFLRSDVEDRLQALNGEGIYLLTSVDALHSAEERDEADGEVMGLFTRHMVTGLESGEADIDRDGRITINDLQLYLNRSIRRQAPRFWTFDAGQDIVLCHRGNPRVAALHPALSAALENPLPSVRLAAVQDLERLLHSGEAFVRPTVIKALERAVEDDSRRISRLAQEVLKSGETTRDVGSSDVLAAVLSDPLPYAPQKPTHQDVLRIDAPPQEKIDTIAGNQSEVPLSQSEVRFDEAALSQKPSAVSHFAPGPAIRPTDAPVRPVWNSAPEPPLEKPPRGYSLSFLLIVVSIVVGLVILALYSL